MARQKSLKPKDVVRLLKERGFVEKRQKGSHLFLVHPESRRVAVVPMHADDLPRGTLMQILRSADIHL